LAQRKISDLNCLSPKGEFSNRLEQALDLSKNVLDQAKRDLGNSPFIGEDIKHPLLYQDIKNGRAEMST